MDFTVGDHQYVATRIPARVQFHIVRRLTPFLAKLAPALNTIKANGAETDLAVLEPLGDALAGMTDADADYVMFGLLRYAKRRIPGGAGLAEVVIGETVNHMDINLVHMLMIAASVFKFNLADFMGALPSDLLGALQK